MASNKVNVLSLFDGISCGQQALERLGVEVGKYYASEIDKYAISITQKNYPDTIQLGDVAKWHEWDIDWGKIDLIIGGSPCQGFSMAGKQLAFDDPRSALFFVFVDIRNHIQKFNQDVKFLLENVRMKKEHLAVITEYMGVEPVMINSALVSAQNRVRFYWANWEITQPEDRGILLKDILETGVDADRDKANCITTSNTIFNTVITGGAMRGRYNSDGKTEQQLEVQNTGKSNSITTVQKDSLVVEHPLPENTIFKKNYAQWDTNNRGNASQDQRAYYSTGKHGTLTSNGMTKITDNLTWRKLTPLECERLQTVNDNYTAQGVNDKGETVPISNTQRYRALGNGWTVEVIKHIFGGLYGKQ